MLYDRSEKKKRDIHYMSFQIPAAKADLVVKLSVYSGKAVTVGHADSHLPL
jgi:hypothetical protein